MVSKSLSQRIEWALQLLFVSHTALTTLTYELREI